MTAAPPTKCQPECASDTIEINPFANEPPMTSTLDDARLASLSSNIQSKLAQLKHYRDHDCQLDHAKTIAEGRIIQLEQVAHWIATEYAAPARCDAESVTAKLQEIVDLDSHGRYGRLAREALAALVSPPSEAGREEIARIIDGVTFRPQHISGIGLTETEKEKWLRARNVAYYKADQIHALSPDHGTVAVASAALSSTPRESGAE